MERLYWGLILCLVAACSSSSEHSNTNDTADTVDDSSTPRDTGERDPVRDLDPDKLPSTATPCRSPELMYVKEVFDGDTIKVEGKWGGESVRLIGIDTSEMDWQSNQHECWAKEAMDAISEKILQKWVWLTFDATCEDDFDRTLAYVHRDTDIEGFIQRSLLRAGHAESYHINPNTHHKALFEADESFAKREDLGRWGACP